MEGNNMQKKVVFLDIDGTMMDYTGTISQSTKDALYRAKMNGHKMVICTGRSRYQIPGRLMELGFDGIVAAAGSYVEYQGQEIFHAYIEKDQMRLLSDYLEKHRFTYVIQTTDCSVLNQRSAQQLLEFFRGRGLPEGEMQRFHKKSIICEDVWNARLAEKSIYHHSPFPLEQIINDLSPYFSVTPMSFDLDANSGEIGIAGINKATGMQTYFDYCGLDQDNSIAIGDGANDMEMVSFAKVGVAMGNAWPRLKEVADMVTKDINEDGIYHVFETLELI